jgi:RNA polymerase sigma-70 factor (ECF subfamily)
MSAMHARVCVDEPATFSGRGGSPGRARNAAAGFDLERFVRLHQEDCYRLALRLTRDRDAAWDLVHDTYERALGASSSYVPEDRARSWLTVIMRNLYYDQWRSKRRHPHVDIDELGEDHPACESEEEPAWADLSIERVRGCLERLAPPLREVYELHTFAGLSYNEISSSLRLPAGTVGTRLYRARQKLKRALCREMRRAAAA